MARIARAFVAFAMLASGCDEVQEIDMASLADDTDRLASWLAGGEYADWESDSEVRDREEAGGARVYLSPAMVESLDDAMPSHPVGASAVRELYEADLSTLKGYAITIKVEPGESGGEAWFWYETFDPDAATDPLTAQQGAPGCIGCHIDGVDFIQSPYPLP